jgi:phage gp36-like protein
MQPVRREVGGAPRNVRTVEHEGAVLNVFEEDGTRSIRPVSREMGLSKSSVQRVLADNTSRRHPYHYTRVQHPLPEDYPIRREFCL